MRIDCYWADEQESGPPTVEDDGWFQHHVVSKGYPKVKREPKQLPGQQKLDDPSCQECKGGGWVITKNEWAHCPICAGTGERP